MIDIDYERSLEEQLPLDKTVFRSKDGVRCTRTVNGKERTKINGKLKLMNGEVAGFNGVLKLRWNGKWHEVPSMAAFHEWTMDSVCPTPDGDVVEPDHEDSWLRLAGLV
jgi:hypothetical protein